MASGYSQPGSTYRHLNPIDVFDENLVATVLGAKQQRYDKNVATIDAALQQYGNIDLLREEDKQYLNERLTKLTDSINNAGTTGLDSSSVTRNILSHIDQAVDENVIEQMANTQKVRKFYADVEEYKKKKPEQYAKQNEAYALHQSGFTSYMNGDSDTLNNLEYNPYVNVGEEQRKILDEVANNKHGITRKVPTNDGYFVESTSYGMTEYEVRRNLSHSLTPQQRKQLEIDAWASYGEDAPKQYEAYVKPQIEKYNKEKESLLLGYDGKTKAEKAIIDKEVADIDSTIKNIQAKKENPAAIYRFLGEESLVANLSAHYSPTETSKKVSADTSFWKSLEAKQESMDIALGIGDQNNNNSADIIAKGMPTDPDDEEGSNIIATERAENEIKGHAANMRDIYNPAYNRMSSEDRKAFDSSYSKYLEDSGLKDSIENKAAFMLSKNGLSNFLNPTEIASLKREQRDYIRKKKIKETNFKEALDERRAQVLEDTFREVRSAKDRGIMMIDEKGKKVSMYKYLSKFDKVSDMSEEQKKAFQASMFTDIALSQSTDYNPSEGGYYPKTEYNINRLASVYGESEDLPMIVNKNQIANTAFNDEDYESDFEGMKKRMQLPPRMTKAQFDEHIRPMLSSGHDAGMIPVLERVLNNVASSAGFTTGGGSLIIGGEGTKTREALERGMKNGLYDRISIWDDSVEDDGGLRSILNDREDFRSSYESKMMDDSNNFAQNKLITIEPSGTRKGETIAAFEEIRTLSGGILEKGHHINLVQLDNETYLAYQSEEELTIKDGSESFKGVKRSVEISKKDLMENAPAFQKYVALNEDNARITTENAPKVSSDNIRFADNKDQRDYVVGIANMLGTRDDSYLSKFTLQGARNGLYESHPQLFEKGTSSGESYRKFADDILSNSHLFKVEAQVNDFGTYDLAIQYKEGDKYKNLWVDDTYTDDITDNVKLIDSAPQIFLYQYLENLFKTIGDKGKDSVKEDIDILTNLIYPQQ